MRKRINEQKGITLVALVVTIIILLILAGVAIATVTGDNGLFRKAREAVNIYKDAEVNESQTLDYLAGELGELAKYDYNGYAKETIEIKMTDEKSFYLPEGFKLASDSGKTIDEGIVIEDKNGNQWVWVPCYVEGGKGEKIKNAVKYDRYAFTREDWTYRQIKLEEEDVDGSKKIVREDTKDSYYFHESISLEEKESIKRYGGFYIGRYEAGDKESTIAKEMRTKAKYANDGKGDASHTVTIKKNQAPYSVIVNAQCVTLSEEFASANGYNTSKIYTKLCSSYAWDTTLMFMGEEYATNATKGNYKDQIINYKDITGTEQTKEENSGIVLPTGQTEPEKNIYDMGGNVWEHTSEEASDEELPIVRGGGINDVSKTHPGDCPAGSRSKYRWDPSPEQAFRLTMFLK